MWDFFKMLAGPIATIIASCVAVAVTGYFAKHQKNIAYQQKEIAYQQKEIAKENLRLSLFDRRYKTFETIFPYYNALVGWKELPNQKEARTNFFLAYHQSRFLFGENVESIYKELIDAGNKVIGFKENPQLYKDDPIFLSKSFNEIQNILIHVFDDRLNKLKLAIHPYIDFSKI